MNANLVVRSYLKCLLLILVLAALGSQAGCAHRSSLALDHPSPGLSTNRDFVDLRPGTTVAVVIPILRSGGYVLPSLKDKAIKDKTLPAEQSIEAGRDFLGYERDFYSVERDLDGVRVRFRQGEVWRNGKVQKVHAPRVALFEQVDNSHVRLVFLTRASQADHDMAIISARDPARLDEMTHEVKARAECRSSRDGNCVWVPNGIAVTPE